MRYSIFIVIFFISSLCGSCQNLIITDILHYKDPIQNEITIQQDHNEYYKYLSKSVAIFPIYLPRKIPANISQKIEKIILKQIQNSHFFTKILDQKEVILKFNQNGKLQEYKDIYLDTFYSVSVSDQELIQKLGNYLEVKNFLLFQITDWPCINCLDPDTIRMKCRLLETDTGRIIWTGIHAKYDLEINSHELYQKTTQLAEEITDAFYQRFKHRWHKQRFHNLSLL